MDTKEYHRKYAAAHPELKQKARERAKMQRSDAKAFRELQKISAQNKLGKLPLFDGAKITIYFELIIILCLLACFTYLLLQEMVTCYAAMGGSTAFLWLRAIGTEGGALFFSYLARSSSLKVWPYKLVVILVCVFSIYLMNVKSVSKGINEVHSVAINENIVKDLETAIREKRAQRDELRTKRRLTEARKLEQAIDTLRIELLHFRMKQEESHLPSVTISNGIAEIAFRIILMLMNILLADRLRTCLNSFGISRAGIGIPKGTFRISKTKQNHTTSEGVTLKIRSERSKTSQWKSSQLRPDIIPRKVQSIGGPLSNSNV